MEILTEEWPASVSNFSPEWGQKCHHFINILFTVQRTVFPGENATEDMNVIPVLDRLQNYDYFKHDLTTAMRKFAYRWR